MVSSTQIQTLLGFSDVTLNIGLGARSVLGGRLSVAHKLRAVTKALPNILRPGYMGHMYLTPERVWVGEPMLVVQGELRRAVHTDELWELIETIEQDCIAIYDHTSDSGMLFGPDTSLWGEFNVNFFTFLGDKDGS